MRACAPTRCACGSPHRVDAPTSPRAQGCVGDWRGPDGSRRSGADLSRTRLTSAVIGLLRSSPFRWGGSTISTALRSGPRSWPTYEHSNCGDFSLDGFGPAWFYYVPDTEAVWGCGAVGSAPDWQSGGQGFESPQLHHVPETGCGEGRNPFSFTEPHRRTGETAPRAARAPAVPARWTGPVPLTTF